MEIILIEELGRDQQIRPTKVVFLKPGLSHFRE
jgi:hypothetical protein